MMDRGEERDVSRLDLTFGVDPDPVRAVIVAAINQHAANAGLAHSGQGDLLRPVHAP